MMPLSGGVGDQRRACGQHAALLACWVPPCVSFCGSGSSAGGSEGSVSAGLSSVSVPAQQ